VGHQKENYALKYGIRHILDTRDNQAKLTEKTIPGTSA
jgi:hypothetical protein